MPRCTAPAEKRPHEKARRKCWFIHEIRPRVWLALRSHMHIGLALMTWLVTVRWEPLCKRKILRVFSHRTRKIAI